MNAIGIAAEYNPFHNGHAFHIASARKALGAGPAGHGASPATPPAATDTPLAATDTPPVVIALSSSFTQRGLPAVASKAARTAMALAGGADLVLELPFAYSCNGGAEFARGTVALLSRFATHISFGVEDTFDAETADKITDILTREPPSFKLNLRENLGAGWSYPKAVAAALEREVPGSARVFSSPNNTLALSYMACIKERKLPLVPLPVRRAGAAHDESASMIRAALAAAKEFAQTLPSCVNDLMPASSLEILERERGRLVLGTKAIWALLSAALARGGTDLRGIAGMDEGLDRLFLKGWERSASFEDFIGRRVCARYTRGRLQRQAARVLVGLDRWTASALARSDPPYVRVLGFSERGREVISARRGGVGRPQGVSRPQGVKTVTSLRGAAKHGAMAKVCSDIERRAEMVWEIMSQV
ncbi:MAG: nucleotidyltransferase family protein [Synergistaceae bacterium]|jgi:predicted nucleotidyltransferase|nr:nucleotidyltransferase family protein [Synergistaceae bacterium]